VQEAFDAFIQHDAESATRAIELDNAIDAFDVELEKRAVALLVEAAHAAVQIDEKPIRGALTLVKVNNELERIADCGVAVANRTLAMNAATDSYPPTARVMTNSVVGMLRDIAKAYGERDPQLARLVLQSEDVVEQFKAAILRQAEGDVASGVMTVDTAFDLHELANQCTLMADHATNIAEQIIYDAKGRIVRHLEGRWVLGDLDEQTG
jgi:phosphate transport system protein